MEMENLVEAIKNNYWVVIVLAAVILVALFVVLVVRWGRSVYVRERESALPDIKEASSGDELMDILEYNDLDDEESAAFLEQVLLYEKQLDEDDWELIWESAEDGSELEMVAAERAGF